MIGILCEDHDYRSVVVFACETDEVVILPWPEEAKHLPDWPRACARLLQMIVDQGIDAVIVQGHNSNFGMKFANCVYHSGIIRVGVVSSVPRTRAIRGRDLHPRVWCFPPSTRGVRCFLNDWSMYQEQASGIAHSV